MSKLIDLTDQRFGRFTVIKRASDRCGNTAWLCRCDCGNEREVAACSLRSGHTQSCGCYRIERIKEVRFIDLTGQRFGRLTAVGKAGSDKHGQSIWACQCDCGRKTDVNIASLREGHTKSCGCYRDDLAREKAGSKSPLWKGGKYRKPDGYITINLGRKKYVGEHRLVMEKYLNRSLHKDENVHHRNGVRDDNRIENLELKVLAHGKGMEIKDAVAWAKELLNRYEPDALTSAWEMTMREAK